MLDGSGNYSNIYSLLQKNLCVRLRRLANAVNLFIMNTKIENIGDTRKKIIITFSPEQVEEENAKVIADFVRNVKDLGKRVKSCCAIDISPVPLYNKSCSQNHNILW